LIWRLKGLIHCRTLIRLVRLLLNLYRERLLLLEINIYRILLVWFIKRLVFQRLLLGGSLWARTFRVRHLRNVVVLKFLALIDCSWLKRLAWLLRVDLLRLLLRKSFFYLSFRIWFTTWTLLSSDRFIKLDR